LLAVLGISPVSAQVGTAGTPGGISPTIAPPQDNRQAPVQQPDALPGAKAGADRVAPAPADHPVSAMEPTDALFDAINRGDIGTARDAINHGADLSARNVLGMTPMDLSVDLNRNDITFLLLSLRGSDSNRISPSQQAAGGKGSPGKQNRQAERRPTPQSKATTVQATRPAAPQTAKLFAGNGGTPNPNAGFLGFDAGRAAPQ
jgi:hypothetical protein